MDYCNLGISDLEVSKIALGCMRIVNKTVSEVADLLEQSIESGVQFFDHADIYGGGASEEIFSKAVKQSGIHRKDMVLQSKCGIRKGYYDFSYEHIITSVEGSLKRLNTDYLDVLLLHRPDTLMEPEEVAKAFDTLFQEGKVRHFGVSNHNGRQIDLLKKCVLQPIVANQLQFGCAHTGIIDSGLNVNMKNEASLDHDGSLLEYCRINDITIQTWSSLQYGFFEGIFLQNEKYQTLNEVLERIGDERGMTKDVIAIAFILRHPANMQVIAGTTNPKRLAKLCKACDVSLSRKEWYEIYLAAGNQLP